MFRHFRLFLLALEKLSTERRQITAKVSEISGNRRLLQEVLQELRKRVVSGSGLVSHLNRKSGQLN
jgi:hypothetical protein